MSQTLYQDPAPSSPLADKKKHKKKESQDQIGVSATVCAHCKTTTTPLWRRAPNGETICNACGLYLKARNNKRPTTLKRNSRKAAESDCGGGNGNPLSGSCPGGGQCNGTGGSSSCAGCPAFNQNQVNRQTLVCANCRTSTTPLWRRDEANNTICNACGLYYKLHNVHRPVSMKRSVIKRRKRVIVADNTSDEEDAEEPEEPEEQQLLQQQGLSPQSSPVPVPASENGGSGSSSNADDNNQGSAARKTKRHRVIKNNHNHNHNSNGCVPAIEDYIIPKRSNIPMTNTTTTTTAASNPLSVSMSMSTFGRRGPSPRTPPMGAEERTLPHIEKMYSLPSQMDDAAPTYSHSSSVGTLSLPPISSQWQPHRFQTHDPAPHQRLPPIHLPSLTSSGTPVYPELTEFDATLEHLQRLRRRVKPDQIHAFSQLLQAFKEIEFKAEEILDKN
ncbi:putative electron transfer flavoprotein subunit [Apophysomyces sp. BC1034]|nr:putative electron transfer flavoprotein subunit [Apophysomyces sp. BC1015]KAG0176834.1 putative electron transfer flavoprotein subunit [Apophysomyces sp. BC1021]KAG0187148.1 putative electron transfer flavoprotein subunit [Apophysomyces sp. BC1034]